MMNDNENRVRVFWIDERAMIDFLRMTDRLPEVLCLPKLEPLPDGAKILHRWMSDTRHAFSFLVQHDSFGEVPLGSLPPDGHPVFFERVPVRLYPLRDATMPLDQTSKRITTTVGKPVEVPTDDGSDTKIVFPYERFSVQNFSRDDLLKLREEINTRLFDLERSQ